MNRLMRSRSDRKIAGVCGGLAQTYEWDATVVRLVALALLLFGGGGLLAYVICWVVVPEEPVGMPYGASPYGSSPSAQPPYEAPPTPRTPHA